MSRIEIAKESMGISTTSLWRVHGEVGKVVIYIENPDKTIIQETVNEQTQNPNNHYIHGDIGGLSFP